MSIRFHVTYIVLRLMKARVN